MTHHCSKLPQQARQVVGCDRPDDVVTDREVAVRQLVPESHDPAAGRNPRGHLGCHFGELPSCLADDLELTLHR